MSDDVPDDTEFRQVIVPEMIWFQVEAWFNANGIMLGRVPADVAGSNIPTYIPTYLHTPTDLLEPR